MILALSIAEKVGGGFAALVVTLLLACLALIIFENLKASGDLSKVEVACMKLIFGMSVLTAMAMSVLAFGFFFIL